MLKKKCSSPFNKPKMSSQGQGVEEIKLEILDKEDEILRLKNALDHFQELNLLSGEDRSKLAKLFEQGVIDENGECILNQDH